MALNDFAGARNSGDSNIVPISQSMFAYFGTAEDVWVNPNPAIFRRLHIHVEANGIFLRPGDYSLLGPFNATSDVDATADTIVITGVEARMVPIVDVSNSLTHTVGGIEATDDRLIYGPVQLSVATGVIVVGLVVGVNYWIAKPSDTGVVTDEVAFYASEADALLAADLPANDDRLTLTAAVGTINFAGMANNGLSNIGVGKTDGYSSLHLDGPIDVTATFAAPDSMTVAGDNAATDVAYWWTP
jgi:hypothetical protein